MNIRPRLTLSYGVLLGFLAVVMAVSATRLDEVVRTTRAMVEEDARRTELAHAVNLQAESAAGRLLLLFILEEREQRVAIYQEIDRHNAAIDLALEALQPLMLQDEMRGELARLVALRQAFDAPFTATVEALETGERKVATQLMAGRTRAALRALLDATAAMAERQQASMAARQADTLAQAQGAIRVVLILGAIALAAGLFMAWRMTRSIVMPLGLAVHSANRIADGDLGNPVPQGSEDELGQLLARMAHMRKRLVEVIDTIRRNAERVSQSARELVAPGERVESGSNEQSAQAGAIETSVASFTQGIGELAANVQTTRDEALKARDLAQGSAGEIVVIADAIVAIAATVEESAQSVMQLEQSALEVAGTVGVIREIADQTNLLALNASIEAARAGESGRGFAVVADEVRKLAHRTAEATQRIDQVIATINQQTQQATKDIANGKAGMERGTGLIRGLVAPLESLRDGAQRSLDNLESLTDVVAGQLRESHAIAAHVGTIVGMASANQAAAAEVARITGDLGATSADLQVSVAIFRA